MDRDNTRLPQLPLATASSITLRVTIRYRASRYVARLPTRSAESGSLALCAAYFLSLPSDPAVTSNALAIRIDFPLVGATPVSFNRP
jgi:hypothetical protein